MKELMKWFEEDWHQDPLNVIFPCVGILTVATFVLGMILVHFHVF